MNFKIFALLVAFVLVVCTATSVEIETKAEFELESAEKTGKTIKENCTLYRNVMIIDG